MRTPLGPKDQPDLADRVPVRKSPSGFHASLLRCMGPYDGAAILEHRTIWDTNRNYCRPEPDCFAPLAYSLEREWFLPSATPRRKSTKRQKAQATLVLHN